MGRPSLVGIVVVVPLRELLLRREVVCFLRCECGCVLGMISGAWNARKALKRDYSFLDAYTMYIWLSLWYGQANKETCRDCANLVVDLDWSIPELQIIIVDIWKSEIRMCE